MAILGQSWLAPPDDPADLNGDDKVDLADFDTLATAWRASGRPLFINEIQASNTETIQDPQAQYDDWIEIYNGGNEPVDVGGMYLTDDLDAPTQWQIPSGVLELTTIPARGYLLIWADGDTADTGLHASFSLDAGGEEIALFDTDGTTLIDAIDFADQETDLSFGRPPRWQRDLATAGLPNTGSGKRRPLRGFRHRADFQCRTRVLHRADRRGTVD